MVGWDVAAMSGDVEYFMKISYTFGYFSRSPLSPYFHKEHGWMFPHISRFSYFFFIFFSIGDLSSNDGFVDMPEMGAPQTPSQHGTYVGSSSPYSVGHGGHDSVPSSIHHFPHFTPDGIPVYPPLGI